MATDSDQKRSFFDMLNGWPASRKLSLVGITLLSMVIFAVIIIQAQTADYSLLFANLQGSDAATVVDWLKDHKIPYELRNNGQSVYVPAEQVYEARLQLAGAGLPQGGGVGFEIFDKQSFGMTDFAQKVNYRRALQGELARTIASLAPVEAARVHLALPEKRLFKSEQEQASASVILKLGGARQLSQRQIQGIIHLVASSIEGLEPDRVTIVDSSGKVLSAPDSQASDPSTSPGMLNHQMTLESQLEQRAQALLDTALGAGNSMVQITAQIDYAKREQVEELYDPKRTAVVSEQSTEEKTSGTAANTSANANFEPVVTGGSGPTSHTEDTVNYEVSKTVNKLVSPVGTLQSISVAVLVADKQNPPAKAGGEVTYTPRDPKELKSIEEMVRSALGIDDSRGDHISVVSMPFETGFINAPAPETSPFDRVYEFMPLVKYLLLGFGALLLYLLLVRPMIRSLKGAGPQPQFTQYKTVEELESELSGETPMLSAPSDPAERLRRQLMKSQSSPTQVVKAWMQES